VLRPYHYEHLHYVPEERRYAHPLLFIHGAWHGAWCWDEHFLPYFAACGFEVHALSLRGHGTSDGRRMLPITRLADYVDDVRVWLARFEVPPVLVGHSMGGLVIQHLLMRGLEVPGAVLLAPCPHFGTVGVAWRTLTRRPRTTLKIISGRGVHPLVTNPEPDGTTFFSPRLSHQQQQRYISRFVPESFPAVGVDMLFLDLPRPQPPTSPLLVMGGQYDTLFPPGEIQRTAQAYGTRAVIVADLGHEMMLDPGWERVADYVAFWLQKR